MHWQQPGSSEEKLKGSAEDCEACKPRVGPGWGGEHRSLEALSPERSRSIARWAVDGALGLL